MFARGSSMANAATMHCARLPDSSRCIPTWRRNPRSGNHSWYSTPHTFHLLGGADRGAYEGGSLPQTGRLASASHIRHIDWSARKFWSPAIVSESGTPLAYSTVGRTFLGIVRGLGISGGPHQHGPNLRCLRHSFAVRRMLDWYGRGMDVNVHLPHLSVYLGHAKPQHTYWYLTATPDLLATAAARFESYWNPGGAP